MGHMEGPDLGLELAPKVNTGEALPARGKLQAVASEFRGAGASVSAQSMNHTGIPPTDQEQSTLPTPSLPPQGHTKSCTGQ